MERRECRKKRAGARQTPGSRMSVLLPRLLLYGFLDGLLRGLLDSLLLLSSHFISPPSSDTDVSRCGTFPQVTDFAENSHQTREPGLHRTPAPTDELEID